MWSICLLHMNELLLRHLFQHIDGKNSGPFQYEGEIGKEICDMSRQPKEKMKQFTNFKAIAGLVPKDINKSLLVNPDQQYFYKFCLGIQEGQLDHSWTFQEPGRINMARWACDPCPAYIFLLRNDNSCLFASLQNHKCSFESFNHQTL